MSSRYWAFIVYPESIVENWETKLEEKGLTYCISPLHDKDIDPTGETKKPHYHVLVEFPGPKRYKNVLEITEEIGATIPKKVESVRGYWRYLTHMDNPDKAQYKVDDIRSFNGFKIELTNTETTMIKKKICEIIIGADIQEYSDLLDYFREIGDNDFWEIASNHTYFFDKYITSRRHKTENKKQIRSMKK